MRIRPICVVAILSWGLACGAGVAHGQGFPAYAPNGYPPPGYGMPYGPPPGNYGYPQPGYYAPPGAMPNPYAQPSMAMPPGAMAFPGYANYPGFQAPAVPTAPPAPAARMPATPAGTSSAGNGQAVPAPDTGAPAGELLQNLPTPVPTGPPPSTTPPSTIIPAPATPSEPLVSYLPGNLLQPFTDPGPGMSLPPQRTPDRAWFRADYLMGFSQPMHTPAPLITTSSNPGSPIVGGLGDPATSIVVGSTLNFNQLNGFRLNAGFFVDNNGQFSIEGDGMYYFPSHLHAGIQSDTTGNPVIGRPIFDLFSPAVGGPTESAVISSLPGTFVGGSFMDARTELYGFEINGRYNLALAPQWRADMLFGFRYVRLTDSLDLNDNLTTLVAGLPGFGAAFPAGIPGGSLLTDYDSFHTSNTFYGLQVGGRVRWDMDWLSMNAYGKFAIGPGIQEVSISGMSTVTNPAGGSQSFQGGVLALPSNIGTYRRTVFDVVPEVGFNLAINVTQNLQVIAGYSFFMWTSVARAGDQIDHNVNPSEVPTSPTFGVNPPAGASNPLPAAPLFHFVGDVYWIHSINLGINVHF